MKKFIFLKKDVYICLYFKILIIMSLKHLNNVHLDGQQKNALEQALTQLEQALQPLNVTHSPEERHRYGSVNEQNKLFINKVYDFMKSQRDLASQDVDWMEFEKDFESRKLYENCLNRLDAIILKLKNAKTLHDHDNYHDALNDHAYTSYKAGANIAGYEDKHRELKQFFTRTKKKKDNTDAEKPSEGQK